MSYPRKADRLIVIELDICGMLQVWSDWNACCNFPVLIELRDLDGYTN